MGALTGSATFEAGRGVGATTGVAGCPVTDAHGVVPGLTVTVVESADFSSLSRSDCRPTAITTTPMTAAAIKAILGIALPDEDFIDESDLVSPPAGVPMVG